MDPSDDGKVIDGKIVVWLWPQSGHVAAAREALRIPSSKTDAPPAAAASRPPARPDPQATEPKPPASSSSIPSPARMDRKQEERMATAKASAASLKTAAKNGVPFCADCEAARKQMLAGVE